MAARNMKQEIREPRNLEAFWWYLHHAQYLLRTNIGTQCCKENTNLRMGMIKSQDLFLVFYGTIVKS